MITPEIGWPVVLALGLVVTIGTMTQAVVGFGLAVVTAPFVVIFAPDLMPAALLVTSLALPVIQLARGERDIDWPNLRWAVAGRVLLMPAGVALVALTSPTVIAVIVGVMVLVAVAGSLSSIDVRPRPTTAFGAGLITGISGTAASIGGPFFGLVLQHERPSRIRGTLAVFFVVGATTSLAGLAVVGEVNRDQVVVGLAWIPFLVLGLAVSGPVRRRVAPERMRRYVLTLAVVAGVTVIARALLS